MGPKTEPWGTTDNFNQGHCTQGAVAVSLTVATHTIT